ncbi:MAG: class I SAM-dependent methyltransferase [Candidatus Paceibacterota bacterium]|jgi:ubiquinone/menaquinone biosynthesis C-methylase UbiE|nr:class I SAM-dependent methyltransferase [Candidatus Paceibacterota bacterium]MDD5555115.1 class I SAM-dependent methyltransferase [Candidatus Paceibacterota bacterium]
MEEEFAAQENYYNNIKKLNISHYAGEISYYSKEPLRHAEKKILSKLKTGKRLLDLGCGSGRFSIGAAQMGFNVTGIDITSQAIEAAKQKARELRITNVSFLCEDMTNLSFEGDVFDYIFCPRFSINAVATFSKRKKAIEEMLRVTKDGGTIFIESFNKFYLGRGVAFLVKNLIRDFRRCLSMFYCYLTGKPYKDLLIGDIIYESNKVMGAPKGYAHLPTAFELIKLVPKGIKYKFYSIPQIIYKKKVDFLKFFRYSIWIFIIKGH